MTLTADDYGLAQRATLSWPWPSSGTLLGVFARETVTTSTVAPAEAVSTPTITIRTRTESGAAAGVSTNVRMSSTLRRSVEAVVELLALPQGWNSYSANPVAARNAIEAIRILLEYLTPGVLAPAVVPTVQGGIQLEWHTNGIDLEIYIESRSHVTFFAEKIATSDCLADVPLKGHEGELRTWLQSVSGK